MQHTLKLAALGAAALLTTACAGIPGGESTSSDIEVKQTWARETPPLAVSSAAYMQLVNHGDTPDRLISADGDVAGSVELHTHLNDDGLMRMTPVDAIDIAAGGRTVLQPRGLHVMLVDLEQPLNDGDHFPLTLTFEKAGEITIDVPVKRGGAGDQDQLRGKMHGGMQHHRSSRGMQNHHQGKKASMQPHH